jgi:hypothetical protein
MIKKDFYHEFTESFAENQEWEKNNLFSKETTSLIQSFPQTECSHYLRQRSFDEMYVLTDKAFELLIFWVRSGEIEIEFFERFMSIAVSLKNKLIEPIDEHILPTIIEMLSIVGYDNEAISSTFDICLENPDKLTKRFTNIL